jgi:putative heme iron utilization protein
VRHLNRHHADALLAIARALGGYPDATAAECSRVDRGRIDLAVRTPCGRAAAGVGFPEAVVEGAQRRAATVELTRRARAAGTA